MFEQGLFGKPDSNFCGSCFGGAVMSNALLDIHALRQTFPRADGGELLVLDGIELQLIEGQIVGLLGRTGSGKSTLLRSIAGLMPASAGTITYLGAPGGGPAARRTP